VSNENEGVESMCKSNLNKEYKQGYGKAKMMKCLDGSEFANEFTQRIEDVSSNKPENKIIDLLNIDKVVFLRYHGYKYSC
jgi:hypothetical protein